MAVTELALRSIFDRFAERAQGAEPAITPTTYELFVDSIPDFLDQGIITKELAFEVFADIASPEDQTVKFHEFGSLIAALAHIRYPDEDPGVAHAHFVAMNVFRISDANSPLRGGGGWGSPRNATYATYTSPSALSHVDRWYEGYSHVSHEDRSGGVGPASGYGYGQHARARLLSPLAADPRAPTSMSAAVDDHYEYQTHGAFHTGIDALGRGTHPAQLAADFERQQREQHALKLQQAQPMSEAQRRIYSPRPINPGSPTGSGIAFGHSFTFCSEYPDTVSPSVGAGAMTSPGHGHTGQGLVNSVAKHGNSGSAASIDETAPVGRASAQDMAVAHRLMTALDRVALRVRTRQMYAGLLALAFHAKAAKQAAEFAAKQAKEAEEKEKQLHEDRLAREAAAAAAAAAQMAARQAADNAAKAQLQAAARSRTAWAVGSVLGLLLLLSLLGWGVTVVAVGRAASVLGGHCEIVGWWHEQALQRGYNPPGAWLGDKAEAGRTTPPLEWRADTGCLHAYGLRTPVCVTGDCIRRTFGQQSAAWPQADATGAGSALFDVAGGVVALEDEGACTNVHGCGLDRVAV